MNGNQQSPSALATGESPIRLDEDSRAFCKNHQLEAALGSALQLTKLHFASIREIKCQLREDPDNGEQWLTLSVQVAATIPEAVESYRHYAADWVKSAPWPQRGMVRLSYNTV
jgi:hypothetical protein